MSRADHSILKIRVFFFIPQKMITKNILLVGNSKWSFDVRPHFNFERQQAE